jgi:hypothetical protein
MEKIIIKYSSSVLTPAGWRHVSIEAEAKKTSEKMVTIIQVLKIDGNSPVGYTSRTGAKRQKYHAAGIAKREVGMRKRLSACMTLGVTQ